MLRNAVFALGLVATVAAPARAALPPSVMGVAVTIKNDAATRVRFTVSLSQKHQIDHAFISPGQPPPPPAAPRPIEDPKANPPHVIVLMPGEERTVEVTGFGNTVSVVAEVGTADCCSIRGNFITRGHAFWDGSSDQHAHLTLHEHSAVFSLTKP